MIREEVNRKISEFSEKVQTHACQIQDWRLFAISSSLAIEFLDLELGAADFRDSRAFFSGELFAASEFRIPDSHRSSPPLSCPD